MLQTFQNILEGIADNLLSQVPILIGLIALLGLLLQRKPFGNVVGGTIRAAIGVVIMTLGIDIFVGGLVNFQTIVASAVGLTPPESTSTLDDFLLGAGSVAPSSSPAASCSTSSWCGYSRPRATSTSPATSCSG